MAGRCVIVPPCPTRIRACFCDQREVDFVSTLNYNQLSLRVCVDGNDRESGCHEAREQVRLCVCERFIFQNHLSFFSLSFLGEGRRLAHRSRRILAFFEGVALSRRGAVLIY